MAIFLFQFCSVLQAQNLNVNNGDGTTTSYSIEDIRRITIEQPNLVVLLFNGDSFSFPLNELQNYRYDDDSSLNLDDALGELNKWDVKLFPNPTANELTIRFVLNQPSNMSYSIVDASGKLITSQELGKLDSGQHDILADFRNIASGSYVVNIERDGMIYSTKIIKE